MIINKIEGEFQFKNQQKSNENLFRQKLQSNYIDASSNAECSFSDSNLSIINNLENNTINDSRDLKPQTSQLKKLFQQVKNSMFPNRVPLKEINYNEIINKKQK